MHVSPRAGAAVARIALMALTGILAACGSGALGPGSPTPTASARPTPEATGALLTVQTRGGLCADGPCGSTIVVERDGRIHVAAKPPNDVGRVDPGALAALEAAIAAADFEELRSHPFTGTCPVAYDGQELVLEFATPRGLERIASCEVAIDPDAPLFRAVAAALGPSVALPAP